MGLPVSAFPVLGLREHTALPDFLKQIPGVKLRSLCLSLPTEPSPPPPFLCICTLFSKRMHLGPCGQARKSQVPSVLASSLGQLSPCGDIHPPKQSQAFTDGNADRKEESRKIPKQESYHRPDLGHTSFHGSPSGDASA